jgi:hypothetical protein
VAEVDHRLLEAMEVMEDHLLNYQRCCAGGSEVLVVAVGSRVMMLVGAAYYRLVQNQGLYHYHSARQFIHFLLLLENLFLSPFA